MDSLPTDLPYTQIDGDKERWEQRCYEEQSSYVTVFTKDGVKMEGLEDSNID